jgi:hypothetical protein
MISRSEFRSGGSRVGAIIRGHDWPGSPLGHPDTWPQSLRTVAALTRELLTLLGCSVIQVSSADAALGALANVRGIDGVLSDVMMPGGVSA